MKRAWPLFGILFLLSACGSSNNSGVPDPLAVDGTTTPPGATVVQNGNVYQMTTGLQGSSPYVFANYQFKEGGCDTGLHRFSGPAAEIALAQMCAGLMNSFMNHNCAADLRASYYAQVCQ